MSVTTKLTQNLAELSALIVDAEVRGIEIPRQTLLSYALNIISLGSGGGGGGDATAANQATQIGLAATANTTLGNIEGLLQSQFEFGESIWIDSTDTYYIRRITISESTGLETITYTLPDGTAYVPVPPISPAGATSNDIEFVSTNWRVINDGVGYSINDLLTQTQVRQTVSPFTVVATFWFNATTSLPIAPPLGADIVPFESDLTNTNAILGNILTQSTTTATNTAGLATQATLAQALTELQGINLDTNNLSVIATNTTGLATQATSAQILTELQGINLDTNNLATIVANTTGLATETTLQAVLDNQTNGTQFAKVTDSLGHELDINPDGSINVLSLVTPTNPALSQTINISSTWVDITGSPANRRKVTIFNSGLTDVRIYKGDAGSSPVAVICELRPGGTIVEEVSGNHGYTGRYSATSSVDFGQVDVTEETI